MLSPLGHPCPRLLAWLFPEVCLRLWSFLSPSSTDRLTPATSLFITVTAENNVPYLPLTFQRQLSLQKSLDSIFLVFIYRSSLAFTIGQRPATSWKGPAHCFLAKFLPQASLSQNSTWKTLIFSTFSC